MARAGTTAVDMQAASVVEGADLVEANALLPGLSFSRRRCPLGDFESRNHAHAEHPAFALFVGDLYIYSITGFNSVISSDLHAMAIYGMAISPVLVIFCSRSWQMKVVRADSADQW